MNADQIERVFRALSIVERDYVSLTFAPGLVRLQCGRTGGTAHDLQQAVDGAVMVLRMRLQEIAAEKHEELATVNDALQLLNAAERTT